MPDAVVKNGSATRLARDFFVGEWLVEPSLGAVSRDGVCTHVEPKAIDVLVCLAAAAGAVVSKEELLQAVWPEVFVSENALNRAVWKLRQVFGTDEFIQTIAKHGYRLAVPVRPAPRRIRSLVVLPLANLSGDPEQEYFADGMTEALITDLAQIRAIRVISRTSAMQYKGAAKPLPQIGTELHVDGIIEGSVVRTGGRVRISVQLIDAALDAHLWARTYESDLRDVLQLQGEVARAIAREVEPTLMSDGTPRPLMSSRSVSPEAHEAYLKGRYCWNRASQDSVSTSIAYFEQAIAIDPNYALAYTGLADVYATIASPIMAAIAPAEAIAKIRPLVQRALELDDHLAEAHQMLGWMKLYHDWDWSGCEAAEMRAIELQPSYSHSYADLGILYGALGRHAEAIEASRRACELDPLSLLWNTIHGWSFVLAAEPARAVGPLQQTLRLDPEFWFAHEVLGFALLLLGQPGEAITELEAAVRFSGTLVFPKGLLGHAYGIVGRRSEAARILNELQELSLTRYVSPVLRAYILVAMGEIDRSFELLEEAFRLRDSALMWLNTILFAPWQNNARHRDLLRRMNFPD